MVFGGCILLLASSVYKGSWRNILENSCLTAAFGYLSVRIYLVDVKMRRTGEHPLNRKDKEERRNATNRTGRSAFVADLQKVLNLRKTIAGSTVTVCILHINQYKTIHHVLGGSASSRLLQTFGSRIEQSCLDAEAFYKVGTDDFAIIMNDYANEELILERIEALISGIDHSIELEGKEYHISFNFGYAVFPCDAVNPEELASHAELAALYAKLHNFEGCRYDKSMKAQALNKLELENEMRKGLLREEFFLEYQPQVHLQTGRIVGLEALVRWNHPKKGLVPPSDFIPLAEECGLIVELGAWVLRTACRQNKLWQEEGYDPVSVSVNLSMRQFRDTRFTEVVANILQETGLDPQYLELEITESMTIDKKSAREQLHDLKKLGVTISIDDFGTGYSSLHYLKKLPIDRIKIDRSFLEELVHGGNDAAIVSTIAKMAHVLKLKLTAEGVENYEQLEFLKLQNCHDAQGYLFSRPIPAMQLKQNFLIRTAI